MKRTACDFGNTLFDDRHVLRAISAHSIASGVDWEFSNIHILLSLQDDWYRQWIIEITNQNSLLGVPCLSTFPLSNTALLMLMLFAKTSETAYTSQ